MQGHLITCLFTPLAKKYLVLSVAIKSAALVLTHDKESHLTLIVSIVVIMTSSGAWINLFSTRSGTFGVTVLTGVCITNSDRCEQVWVLADLFFCILFGYFLDQGNGLLAKCLQITFFFTFELWINAHNYFGYRICLYRWANGHTCQRSLHCCFYRKKTQGVPIPFLTEHCILKEKV